MNYKFQGAPKLYTGIILIRHLTIVLIVEHEQVRARSVHVRFFSSAFFAFLTEFFIMDSWETPGIEKCRSRLLSRNSRTRGYVIKLISRNFP